MLGDLWEIYGIGPRKTLTYQWPSLSNATAATFLSGYIDGDGCVGVYRTPRGNGFLSISLVGTPEFIEGAAAVVPAKGHIIRIARCKNLSDLRYSGRHAWDAGAWLYATPPPESRKFQTYLEHVTATRPAWLENRERRELARTLLAAGTSLRNTAAQTGAHLGTVCVWKKQFAEEEN
jgi:hypothetical protein